MHTTNIRERRLLQRLRPHHRAALLSRPPALSCSCSLRAAAGHGKSFVSVGFIFAADFSNGARETVNFLRVEHGSPWFGHWILRDIELYEIMVITTFQIKIQQSLRSIPSIKLIFLKKNILFESFAIYVQEIKLVLIKQN